MLHAVEVENEDDGCEYGVEGAGQSTNVSQVVEEGIRDPAVSVEVLVVSELHTCSDARRPLVQTRCRLYGLGDDYETAQFLSEENANIEKRVTQFKFKSTYKLLVDPFPLRCDFVELESRLLLNGGFEVIRLKTIAILKN